MNGTPIDGPLDPYDTNPAALAGVDDLGAWLDTGVAILPTARPHTDVDIRALVPTLAALDLDTGTGASKPTLPPPHRAATQRR
jgi:hypothetical protein